MKVLLINISSSAGSVGKIVSNLYKGVIASGNQCKVAYSREKNPNIPEEDLIHIGNSIDVKAHVICTRLFGSTATYSKNSTKKAVEDFRRYQPDVINIHSIYGYYLNMEILFDYLITSNAKIFVTLHSCWDFTGHCCYFTKINCDKWKNGCYSCPNIRSYPTTWLFDNTHRNYLEKKRLYDSLNNTTIISPSFWMDSFIPKSILSKHRHIVIHNGIDNTLFKPTKAKRKDKPLILSVANIWEERKGLNDVLELAEYVGEQANVVIVGLTAKQQAKIHNQNVLPLQRTNSQAELVDLYSEATVFFNPTYEENYPTVNLEAIACHTPVITYDTGGSKETLNGERYGSIVNRKSYHTVLELTLKIFCGQKRYNFQDLSFIQNTEMVNRYINEYNLVTK